MTRSAHPVFATTAEAPAATDWELTGDVFSEQWADESSDPESTDFEEIEWEDPYSDTNETSYADEPGWSSEEFDSGAAEADWGEDSDWSAEESDWGTEVPDFEEAGPGYEETYEESDWPREAPADVALSGPHTIIIPDYPRYATSVTDLAPHLIADMKDIARRIVNELLANNSVNVIVEGFADFDAKGRDFEQQVSIDRAIGARTFLVDEVHRIGQAAGLSATVLKRFSVQSAGFGSRRPTVRYPANEDDRKQNRRVHIVWDTAPVPSQDVQPFDQILDRAQRAVEQVQRPGPKRRLTCLVGKLRDSRAADGYFSYDALKAFPGSAGWPAMNSPQFDEMVKATTVHVRPQLRTIAAAARNEAEMATHLENLDDNIGRNIFNFEQQLVGDSSTGVLMRTFNATIGRLQLDPNSILSCYSGYARIRHDQ